MGKQPAFQFYPGDWFREPGLKCVDLKVRGAWAELLMIMFDCNPRGQKETTLQGFARLWRTSIKEAAFLIDQLDQEHIADVEYFDEDCKKITQELSDSYIKMTENHTPLSQECPVYITVTNRKMFREWILKENDRLKKQRQRMKRHAPQGCPDIVPKKSPSLSSSSSSNIINNKKFYYRDSQQNYVCKTCQKPFTFYENFLKHECEVKK